MWIGQRVRLVNDDGCMAHIRGKVREGVIQRFENKKVYGDTQKRQYAIIKMDDDGSLHERVTEPRLWTVHEGLQEYHS